MLIPRGFRPRSRSSCATTRRSSGRAGWRPRTPTSPACRSPRARSSSASSAPPTGTPRTSPSPTGSTSGETSRVIWRLARGSTTASVRRSRGSRPRSRSATLLRRFPALTLAVERPVWRPSSTLRGLDSLPVTLGPTRARSSSPSMPGGKSVRTQGSGHGWRRPSGWRPPEPVRRPSAPGGTGPAWDNRHHGKTQGSSRPDRPTRSQSVTCPSREGRRGAARRRRPPGQGTPPDRGRARGGQDDAGALPWRGPSAPASSASSSRRDLLPSDVLGVSVYEPDKHEFVFKPGPIFTNIVLADEINRTTPKTQSSAARGDERGAGLARSHDARRCRGRSWCWRRRTPCEYAGHVPAAGVAARPLPPAHPHRLSERGRRAARSSAAPARPAVDTLETVLDADDVVELQEAAELVRVDDSIVDYSCRS